MSDVKKAKGRKAKLTDKQREVCKQARKLLAEGKLPREQVLQMLEMGGIAKDEAKHQETLIIETKEDRFRRLALKRVPKALKALDAVRVLLKGASYAHTEEQAAKVVGAIKLAFDAVHAAANGKEQTKESFTL